MPPESATTNGDGVVKPGTRDLRRSARPAGGSLRERPTAQAVTPRGEDGRTALDEYLRELQPTTHAEQPRALGHAIARIAAEVTGRAPAAIAVTIGEDVICAVLRDTLTRGDLSLLANGERALVDATRRAHSRSMAGSVRGAAQTITGREVVAVHSDHSCHPVISTISIVLGAEPD